MIHGNFINDKLTLNSYTVVSNDIISHVLGNPPGRFVVCQEYTCESTIVEITLDLIQKFEEDKISLVSLLVHKEDSWLERVDKNTETT
jgi:hypothetical protein